MCSLLIENAPAKAKAVNLETLMSETEPAPKEWKLELVDLDETVSSSLSLLVTVFSSVLC